MPLAIQLSTQRVVTWQYHATSDLVNIFSLVGRPPCPSVCICVVVFSFFIFLMLHSERSFAAVHQKVWADKSRPAADKSCPGKKNPVKVSLHGFQES